MEPSPNLPDTNFVPAEIVDPRNSRALALVPETVATRIARIMSDCIAADGHHVFFGAWEAKLTALTPAYQLMAAMDEGGKEAVDEVFKHPHFLTFQRGTPRSKLALIAVRFLTKPEYPDDLKTASAYAKMLEHAHDSHVDPADFLGWASKISLRECRKAISKKRKLAKQKSDDGEVVGDPEASRTHERQQELHEDERGELMLTMRFANACAMASFDVDAGVATSLLEIFRVPVKRGCTEFLLEIGVLLGAAPALSVDKP